MIFDEHLADMSAGLRSTIDGQGESPFTAQTATHQWILFITAMEDYAEEKITEQKLIVRSGKSEAEVTNNSRLRSTSCTVEASYRQEVSRAACLRQQGYL